MEVLVGKMIQIAPILVLFATNFDTNCNFLLDFGSNIIQALEK